MDKLDRYLRDQYARWPSSRYKSVVQTVTASCSEAQVFQAHLRARAVSLRLHQELDMVGYLGGITQRAGDVISFGFIGISEIARSLP